MQSKDAGIKSGKNGNIKRKRRNVKTRRKGSLFMRAKTEKYEDVFYTNKTNKGCIMQKEMYTLVYFV